MNDTETGRIDHPFLQTMPEQDWDDLLTNVQEKEYWPSEMLFLQGAPANQFFLIQSGKVAVEKRILDRPVLIEEVGTGDVLGWSWLFSPFAWHFQARALEQTSCLILDGAHLLVVCEENSDFGYRLMKRISQMVIHQLIDCGLSQIRR